MNGPRKQQVYAVRTSDLRPFTHAGGRPAFKLAHARFELENVLRLGEPSLSSRARCFQSQRSSASDTESARSM